MTINLNLQKAAETQARRLILAAAESLSGLGITRWCEPGMAVVLYRWHRRMNPKIPEYEPVTIEKAQRIRNEVGRE